MGCTSKSVKAIRATKQATQKAAKTRHHAPKLDRYCELCDHEFRVPKEYSRHRTQTIYHNGFNARKFFCDLCPKRFTQPYNLKNHRRIHFGETVACNLPKNSDPTETCQKTFTDRNNLRTHIRRMHLAKFNPVPAWLEDAVERRLNQIRTKPKPYGSTKRSIRESLSPLDSPLATPSPQPDRSIHIFNAETMESPQPELLATEHRSLASQPGELDIELLNSLGVLPSSKGTLDPEHPSIASALPDVTRPTAVSYSSNTYMNLAALVPRSYEYSGTLPQETLMRIGGQPQASSEVDYRSHIDSGTFPSLLNDQRIFGLNNLAVTPLSCPADILGNVGQGQLSLYTYPHFNGSDVWSRPQHDCWTGYIPTFGTSV